MTSTDDIDAIVLGAGPAGCVAAGLLARWGHRVVLVARPRRRPSLGESLPPSCVRLFHRLGFGEALGGAAFVPYGGNTIWWGRTEAQSTSFPAGARGVQVAAADLEAALLETITADGVRPLAGTVTAVDLDDPDRVHARVTATAGGDARLTARMALDCTGRAGVAARHLHRTPVSASMPSTVALVAIWRREGGWDVPDDGHTLIESYADGWAWSVPLVSGDRQFALMVDPQSTRLERGHGLAAAYECERLKTTHVRRLTTGAERVALWSCDSSPYRAGAYGGSNVLLVGDAASFIDPLSSFGVKKAVASAWLAAVVVRTLVRNPAMRQTAIEYYGASERRVHASFATQSAEFFAEAAGAHANRFWTDRASSDDAAATSDVTADGETNVNVEALRTDRDVVRAFDALRAAPGIALRPSPRLGTAERPAVQGREIVLEERVVEPALPGAPGGVRFLRGIDLPALIRMAPDHAHVPDLYESYAAARGPVALADFLGALAVLVGKGVLVGEPAPDAGGGVSG